MKNPENLNWIRRKKSEYMKVFFLSVIILSFKLVVLSAQTYEILKPLDGYKSKVYSSFGNDSRAKIVAERLDKVLIYFQEKIYFEPKVTLLILNPSDWPKFTTFPVYGMPHYDEKRELLIIASENNEFWNSFIPPLDKLPIELAGKIRATYVDEKGNISMQSFFDLLAIHELGHAFQFQAGLNVQRKWMGELFCNILLHTYIAENEPEQLPALTVFPKMVIAGGTDGYKYTSLTDIEQRYEEIGEKYPQNYGWFQSRWHSAAGKIYDSGGSEAFIRLWNSLKNPVEIKDDKEFALLLSKNVHQSVADVLLNWENYEK